MNLELLDPFRRQIPDRVDATLSLPASLLIRGPMSKMVVARRGSNASEASRSTKPPEEEADGDQEWKAAYTVAFNRRGTYLAVGHGSGAVAVHDTLSRTLSALYPPDGKVDFEKPFSVGTPEKAETSEPPAPFPNGVTSVSWSRRSRTLLAGAVGDAHVRLIDTTHPSGPEGSTLAPNDMDSSDHRSQSPYPTATTKLFIPPVAACEYVKQTRYLETQDISQERKSQENNEVGSPDGQYPRPKRYPILSFSFPHPVGGSLQIHPRDVTAGLAVLSNGSLLLFRAPPSAWESESKNEETPIVKTFTIWNGETEEHQMTCAAFDPRSEKVYAATKDGVLMGFQVNGVLEQLASPKPFVFPVQPYFRIEIPGGATAWHLLMSRNGRNVLINCADGALRLYNTEDICSKSLEAKDIKPKVFQDVVSKIPFASADFSGDAEYIVGGCNNQDKYELYLWNATTGALMDRLTGAQVSLYCVAWHPTRSFLAVATSDGIVDIWGPRMDWTAFAPDFQALPMNVEYIEREDEFDIVDEKEEEKEEKEDSDVNVVKIEPVPVFASDSESELEVFTFETKISNIMARGRNVAATTGSATAGRDDEQF